jgi:manganese/iron transport system permease protein
VADGWLGLFAIDFVQQALIAAVLLAIPTAILSCFLVLRGWALMGDAISHAVLPGVVLAYIAGLPLVLGAFAAGMLCAVATGYIAENCRVKRDTVMGVIFSGMFGLGIVMFSLIETDLHLDHILFGDILGLVWSDIRQMAIVALSITVIVLAYRRELLVCAFDPLHARTIGMPVKWLHYGLLVVLSVAIVAGLKAVGLILVIAMLIAPGAIGHLLCNRFEQMLCVAIGAAVIAALGGVSMSLAIGSAPAPTIVVVLMVLFLIALAVSMRRASAIDEQQRAEIKALGAEY